MDIHTDLEEIDVRAKGRVDIYVGKSGRGWDTICGISSNKESKSGLGYK